jgi:hypothetical protein
LAFLRAVDATESDAFGVVVVQDFEGVAVEDGNYRTGDVCRESRSPQEGTAGGKRG